VTAAIVIGIGNRFGGDDGVGPAVADRFRHQCREVPVIETDGEPARLVEAWDNAEIVVLVDAVRSGAAPGTRHRMVLDETHGPEALGGISAPTSSHGAGVAEAWALGRALGRTPNRLVVLGIEGACFEPGHGLTPEVARAVPATAAAICQELCPYPEGRLVPLSACREGEGEVPLNRSGAG
jgi:hydrogenase maturation protease